MKGILFDLDGVLYNSETPIRGAAETVGWVQENGIPHLVHFREGMVIRNFLRRQRFTRHWDSHRLDNEWATIIEITLKLCRTGSKQIKNLLKLTGEYENDL